ncbi:hypothetical protein LCGC14_0866970 [marine sediment metagenome]|uniref:Uncharacterized protein n=1 Tax=marine sediment metagenome TaxID=412755 RepID=A0A0F9PRE2_9ZZZZ
MKVGIPIKAWKRILSNFTMLEEYQCAKIFMKTILDYIPKDVEALLHLGKMHTNLEEFDDALLIFKTILKNDSKNISALEEMGRLYGRKKNKRTAIKYYKRALKVSFYFNFTLVMLGMYLIDLGKVKKALKFVKKGLMKNPLSRMFWDICLYEHLWENASFVKMASWHLERITKIPLSDLKNYLHGILFLPDYVTDFVATELKKYGLCIIKKQDDISIVPALSTINEYLSVKFEDGKWDIYIDQEKVSKNEYNLINFDIKKSLESNGYLTFDYFHLIKDYNVVEYEGVCRILNAWYQNYYFTLLLFHEASFPLLEKLYLADDPRAVEVFQECIWTRFNMGEPSVVEYLFKKGYLDYLDEEMINKLEILKIDDKHIKYTISIKRLGFMYSRLIHSDFICEELQDMCIDQIDVDKALALKMGINLPDEIDLAIYLESTPEKVDEKFLYITDNELIALIWEVINEILFNIKVTKTFSVNENLSLKLENNETAVYIDDRLFIICKYLLMNINTRNISEFDNIDSIDEAANRLNTSLENSDPSYYALSPEEEFWGHCSNLQAWAENKYDTRLLHSNLAFPLLKKLHKVGDPLAKKRFKEEIILRILSGYKPVFTYLIEENYLKVFNIEELGVILDELQENPSSDLALFKEYIEFRKGIPKYDKKVIESLLHFFLNVKEGNYELKKFQPSVFSKFELLNGLQFIQDHPEQPIISRSGIKIRILNHKSFELINSPLYNAFTLIQRVVLYLYSYWEKRGGIPEKFMDTGLKDQMGKLFYKLGRDKYELSPDEIYVGEKIQELISRILEGSLSLEDAIKKINHPQNFIRHNKYPIMDKTNHIDYPIEIFDIWWDTEKYFGLEFFFERFTLINTSL